MNFGKRAFVFASAVLLLIAQPSRADSLLISSGGANALEIKNVKIKRIEADKIFFTTDTGTETSRDLKQVTKIRLDDNPTFTAAEDAFAAQDWNSATDGYQKTVNGTDKQWLKDWASVRLLQSAKKANRFDAEVTAYIALILKDPATASAAQPTLPDSTSTYLDTAVSDVEQALTSPKLSDDQKQMLLNFELEIHRARKDNAKAMETAERLSRLNPTGGQSPEALRLVASLRLSLAKLALDNKDYKKADEEIQSNRSAFVDPADQVDALWCLAEAHAGLAGSDPVALKDVALDYMRVVANFKDSPNAPDALLKVAAIEEKLNEPKTALDVYQQIAAQYASAPAAAKAKESIERLKNVGG